MKRFLKSLTSRTDCGVSGVSIVPQAQLSHTWLSLRLLMPKLSIFVHLHSNRASIIKHECSIGTWRFEDPAYFLLNTSSILKA